ncbi:MAG TPA: hypothetical protein VFS48_01005 [Solirubrobacterales bacterium]|nr:hypothetical protein [Solirubrobacterales bacterium]
MTREGKRPLAALIAAVLATALLAACGGSDSDSTSDSSPSEATSAATTATTTPQDGGDPPEGSSDQSQSQSGGKDRDGSSSSDPADKQSGDDGGGSGSQDVATPLAVSGGGSAQFRVKGGDNSVQEYGEESDESELQEAAEVVHSFYVARAREEWSKACSYLAKGNIEQLEELGSQSPEFKGAGCAAVLEAFTRPLPAAIQREITTVDAGSLRRDGEQGFLIYYGADHDTYAMPLRDEGEGWKVAALSGTTLS